MPETSSTSRGAGVFDDLPRTVKVITVAGWLVVVGLTILLAHHLGWSMKTRPGTKSPLFMLLPAFIYWPLAGVAIWRWQSRRDR